jgi:CO/xanthine dehydrogenase Mo-binding subunit
MAEPTKSIGESLPPTDGVAKVTGAARYANDVKVPGTLYGRTLRSLVPHANIRRIDVSKAKAIPGVVAVLTAADMPESSFRRPLDEGPILNKDKVRYVGDAVAVVAAKDVATAIQAVNAIEVDYEVLPAVFKAADAMRADAPKLYPEGNVGYDTSLNGKNVLTERGDTAKGLAEADRVFEARFTTTPQMNSCPAPRATVAKWEGDQLTEWSPTQGVHGLRRDLATALGIPESKIRVVNPYSGGGYGSGNAAKGGNFMPAAAALLAKAAGQPVRMEFDRWEEIIVGNGRHAMTVDLKIGVKNDGTVTAVDAKLLANTGAWGDYVIPVRSACGYITSLYRSPNIRAEATYVVTNNPSARELRGFGSPQAHFPLESLADEVALGLGMDPLDFKLKNYIRDGDPYAEGRQTVSRSGFEEVLTKGAEAFGWREARRRYPIKSSGTARGIGMAMWNLGPVHSPSSGVVELLPDGTVLVRQGAGNFGTSSHTALGQIAAEVLGVAPDKVRNVFGDSDSTPYDLYSLGSRTILNTGAAIKQAAEEVRQKVINLAAARLRIDPSDVVIEMDRRRAVSKSDPSKVVPFAVLLGGFGGGSIVGSGYSDFSTTPQKTLSNAASFLEVEVDLATGGFKVLRAVLAQDWGKVINRQGAESQMLGGFIQGLGFAMYEDVVVDRGTGIPSNASWIDYKLPMAPDIPEDIKLVLVESGDPIGPYGVKGGGETQIVGHAPALANAIFNAVGVRIRDLPITPDKILTGMNRR